MATPAQTFHLMLRIQGPGGVSRLEDLVRERYVVGRGDPSGAVPTDFSIPADEFLSRAHCRLHKAGETYAVENVSPNGTKLNGKTIDKIVALKHHDKIEIGQETVLEFLAETDEERSRELKAAAGGKLAARADARAKKSFWQKPIFIVMLGIYALIGVVVLAAGGGKTPPIPDPGEGPYLQWMRKAPLQWESDAGARRSVEEGMWDAKAKEKIPEDVRATIVQQMWDAAKGRELIPDNVRRERSQSEWATALLRHGDVLTSGSHAYQLLRSGLEVLGLKGYAHLATALDSKDEVAVKVAEALDALEARLRSLYFEAGDYWKSHQWKPARDKYEAILEALPSTNEPLQRFAAARVEWLKGKK